MPEERRQTPRQRILELLQIQEWSSWDLAQELHIPAREVEDHLTHLVKTVGRLAGKRFVIYPSICRDCRFSFGTRKRLTQPGRCPQCRSEHISPPRFRISTTGSL